MIIADSVSFHSPRLTTFCVKFHKFILAEFNTHKMISRSDRSSRAVSTKQLLEEAKLDPAMPFEFRRNIPGMSGGELLTGDDLTDAQERWMAHRDFAVKVVQEGLEDNEAKETLNRHLDQFVYTHSVRTATEDSWMNFFGLRLDSHAQPEIRILAENMWVDYNVSSPKFLYPGQWHMPFMSGVEPNPNNNPDQLRIVKISAARCANMSYGPKPQWPEISKSLELYNRLVNSSPMHLGPLEHQATPDIKTHRVFGKYNYRYPQLHGNLPGWQQFRKLIPGESIAPLPEDYK
jgi:hypothetical protein